MFGKSETELIELGSEITTREIMQQPELWQEVFNSFKVEEARIEAFIAEIQSHHERVRVIFTGAGTSAYVGPIVTAHLKQFGNEVLFEFQSVPTTDIVSNPLTYYKKDIPTLLVSFARSGNSPESLATVDLGLKLVDDFYQITITCAPDGVLAQRSVGDQKNLLLLMPPRANDQGFAMTGSFSCMTLMTLLVFDQTSLSDKERFVAEMIEMANDLISRENEMSQFVEGDYERVIYLGSGVMSGLAREVQLKILELTAGQIATLYDSSLGFRHGPKSFINDKTLVFMFISNDRYTRQYDLEMLKEIKDDQIASVVCGISVDQALNYDGAQVSFEPKFASLPDAYLVLPFAIFGQTIGLLSAVKLGNKPDTPSPSGTVNRVVQGVTIHDNLDS